MTPVSIDPMEQAVIERLQLCAEEIPGITRAYASPPKSAIVREDFPACYTMVGGTFDFANGAEGILMVPRSFVFRVLVIEMANGADDPTAGTEGITRSLPLYSSVHGHFATHPVLHTATLGPLKYVNRLIRSSDTGLGLVPAPGGKLCLAIDFTLDLLLRQGLPIASVPY